MSICDRYTRIQHCASQVVIHVFLIRVAEDHKDIIYIPCREVAKKPYEVSLVAAVVVAAVV